MGDLADAIAEEFKKKGIPLPNRAVHTRPGVQVIGAAKNGVVQDGGSVKVSPLAMDAAPEKRAEVKDGRVSFRDTTLRDGRYMTTDADEAALCDALAVKDAAYNEYIAGIQKGGQRGFVLDSLPGYINAAEAPKIWMLLADASDPSDETRARAGIEQLLAVARTCRARATAGVLSGEEARNANAAADYIEGLAAAAELVLTGKNSTTSEPAMRR